MSFRGNTSTHQIRGKLKNLRFDGYHFCDTKSTTGASKSTGGCVRSEYVSLILKSRWSLCPRGFGTASFRLYETLMLGMNPVVISDSFVHPELLRKFPIVSLKEKQVSVESLRAIAHEQPISHSGLTPEAIATAFVSGISGCPHPLQSMSLSHCRLNAVLWRLFRRFL